MAHRSMLDVHGNAYGQSSSIYPALGLPMAAGVDVARNPFGSNSNSSFGKAPF